MMKMSEGEEDPKYLDSIDPDDYVVGLVHIPPGFETKDLLNDTSKKKLAKFFRKLTKHPEKKTHKILPCEKDSKIFELISEGSDSQIRLPFFGKSSKGGHCLRILKAHKLQILHTNKEEDDQDDNEDAPEVPTKEACTKKRPKSLDTDVSEGQKPAKRRKKD